MRITDVPFAVMRFQYEMARLPFQLIEEQVAARRGSEAPQADDQLKAKRDKAIQDEIGTREAKEGEIPQAQTETEARKRTAQKAPAKRAASAKRQTKQNATAAATSQLKDAQPRRSGAADKRPQADHVEELADAVKQKLPAEPNIPDPKNQPLT